MNLVLAGLFFLMAVEIYFAPFTKVEESFNLQATHDLLNQVDHYDHLQFPGVVPRTFVGATLLAALCWPWITLFRLNLFYQQLLVRATLAALVVLSIAQFTRGVRVLFGKNTAWLTVLLMLCQFHLVFWSSRTLPNTLALPWVNIGLCHWLASMAESHKRTYHLTWMTRYLTFTGVVFRFEVGILLVVLLATEWVMNRFPLFSMIRTMVLTALISLIITVPLDSYFWNRWLWPEGEVFFFNAILNKSSEWGTLPFHAYFLHFLPRLLLVSYPLSIIAFVRDIRVRRMLIPVIIYISIFSIIPHKEWRFIMYTIPVFTTAAATQMNALFVQRCRSYFYYVTTCIVISAVLGSACIALIMFRISSYNYPGGDALRALHLIEKNTPFVAVHLDPETAMTGASLFGQLNPQWKYSKNESHVTEDDFIEARYTHLLTANPENFNSSQYEVIHRTNGIDYIKLTIPLYKNRDVQQNKHDVISIFGLLQIHTAPKIYILRRIQTEETDKS
ncbi:hypothetical protein G6F70_000591 [Rhizopus microsporus]|uniref:Mannosyltransferase n=2 Tax=Rhizopus TaxID=4842 RepID=A0A367JHN6_RHIAZ|nr:hypothetical protein G6F71_000839 [Rhizopus microsporus]RCH89454.1 hypothetical protein CU097_003916 [Rhizopus azygosporus]KAG1204276.1 hypothetical protein G6F70_000591 [Rhizopus microsporus]KAG1215708.1 hypothetical protein G6F69_000794 [Rhizopus microsporus]KAG1237973.1 hypothetical protein G6F67_000809 [Rhizopus microsporus]